MGLFLDRYGIVPACDVDSLPALQKLVTSTCDLSFIQGYKIGMELVIRHGIEKVTCTLRNHTSLPIIYDHQKFGTDIPDICSGRILDHLKIAGVDAIIIFPQAGVETLNATVTACKALDLVPIVGGEMTHRGYLAEEGGYITSDGPERMYRDAATFGVLHFVVPGTRLESMKRYRSQLHNVVDEPKFLFPGIGKGQGGDIVAAFTAVEPLSAYAIVGRGIYAEEDSRGAAEALWNAVKQRMGWD